MSDSDSDPSFPDINIETLLIMMAAGLRSQALPSSPFSEMEKVAATKMAFLMEEAQVELSRRSLEITELTNKLNAANAIIASQDAMLAATSTDGWEELYAAIRGDQDQGKPPAKQ